MAAHANKSCSPHEFNVSDFITLNTQTYTLNKRQAAGKILHRLCGLFRMPTCTGLSAYKLSVPSIHKIHLVVGVRKLWLFTPCSNVLQIPLPVLLETADTFEVLDILSHCASLKYHQYLVQWRSTDLLYNTWEPPSSLSSCSHVVRH